MNSESARKSPQELKEIARQQMQVASRAEPCVTVTEPNWKALIASQGTQINMLEAIQSGLEPLATRDQMVDYLERQIEVLQQYTEESEAAAAQFQKDMKLLASESILKMQNAVQETEVRVGSMKEVFSNSLSAERDTMKQYTRKLFWVSMIPSAILILLELTPRIWALISQAF